MEMKTSPRVNISEVVGNSNFGSFQLGLCILCGLCPVLVECAAHIRRYPEGEGVWAGTIPEEREEQ